VVEVKSKVLIQGQFLIIDVLESLRMIVITKLCFLIILVKFKRSCWATAMGATFSWDKHDLVILQQTQ